MYFSEELHSTQEFPYSPLTRFHDCFRLIPGTFIKMKKLTSVLLCELNYRLKWCHQYFHEYPLLFHDPIHIAFSYYFSSVTSNQAVVWSFIALHDLDTFQRYWSSILQTVLTLGLSDFFSPMRLWVWGSSHQGEVAFSVNHIRVYMTSVWLITSAIILITGVCHVSQLYVTTFLLLTLFVRN